MGFGPSVEEVELPLVTEVPAPSCMIVGDNPPLAVRLTEPPSQKEDDTGELAIVVAVKVEGIIVIVEFEVAVSPVTEFVVVSE